MPLRAKSPHFAVAAPDRSSKVCVCRVVDQESIILTTSGAEQPPYGLSPAEASYSAASIVWGSVEPF